MITKMFAANSITEGGGRRVAFTRVARGEDLDDLSGIAGFAQPPGLGYGVTIDPSTGQPAATFLTAQTALERDPA